MDKIKVAFMIMISAFIISCNNTEKKAGYSGKDISGEVAIIRDKQTKAASLQINTNGKWELYAGNSVDNIDFSKTIAMGEGSGIFPLNVPADERFYYQLITPEGNAILADSHLPMTGGYNFRDLGGIKNKDGKYVKWGKIFRSDDLNHLTDDDLKYLGSIPLVSIVDFRSEEERKAAPDKNLANLVRNYEYSIAPGNLMNAATFNNEIITVGGMDTLMMKLNELLVTDSVAIEKYRDFFALLQNGDMPLLFHCSAGKDRTGMGAALVLSSLGVDEEIIVNDYLMSNTYLDTKYAKYKEENPAMESLFSVKPEFLKAGLAQIKKDYGSVDNFLTKVLNVDIDKMKELYLY